ncbi:hypothetical protein BH20ACT2_BH20ACT2_08380 [soil metagenome]
MDLGVHGRSAAVVAASSAGLGRASARALVEAGAQVAICGRRQDRADAGVADLGARFITGAALPIDGGANAGLQ